jgi:hypothetical protein
MLYIVVATAVALQIVLKLMHVHSYREIIFFTALLVVLFFTQRS